MICRHLSCGLFQAGESVLSALSGCKMLRELSKLEVETETKLSMKELAQRFENLAHGETVNPISFRCLHENESNGMFKNQKKI